jgi:hypothetical protein
MFDVPPPATSVVADWLKATKDFLFCPKFGSVLLVCEHFQQISLE